MSDEPEDKGQAANSTNPSSKTADEKLREAIQIGIDQAERGEVGPLDIQGTLAKVRSRQEGKQEA